MKYFMMINVNINKYILVFVIIIYTSKISDPYIESLVGKGEGEFVIFLRGHPGIHSAE